MLCVCLLGVVQIFMDFRACDPYFHRVIQIFMDFRGCHPDFHRVMQMFMVFRGCHPDFRGCDPDFLWCCGWLVGLWFVPRSLQNFDFAFCTVIELIVVCRRVVSGGQHGLLLFWTGCRWRRPVTVRDIGVAPAVFAPLYLEVVRILGQKHTWTDRGSSQGDHHQIATENWS